ncbi:MAG: zinc-binding dehydrogenase [Myxococcota bacterium]
MLAEEVINADSLVRIPDALDFVTAASLPCAGLSAWSSLMAAVRRSRCPGSTVRTTLGAGGVCALRRAARAGDGLPIMIAVTTSSASKAHRLESLGKTPRVVNYQETPEWGARVLELTDGVGVDLVVEVGGPNTLPQSIRATKAGGRIAMVGIVGGLGSIDYVDMLPINHKVLTLFANGMGSRADLEDLLRFAAETGLEPVIDSTFGFDRAADAIAHFAGRGHVGKVVIAREA